MYIVEYPFERFRIIYLLNHFDNVLFELFTIHTLTLPTSKHLFEIP